MTDVGIDRGPVRLGLELSAAATGTATLALALSGPPAGVGLVALAGAVLVGGGLLERPGLLDLGALIAFAGVLLAGTGGTAPGPLLLAAVGTVVAWDAADHAVSVGHQLGPAARTRRVVVVHVAESTVVGVGGALVGYGVFRIAGGGQPVSALVLLLAGGVLVTWALRR